MISKAIGQAGQLDKVNCTDEAAVNANEASNVPGLRLIRGDDSCIRPAAHSTGRPLCKAWPCLQGTPVRVQILIASVLKTAPWTNMSPSPKAPQRGDGFEGNQLLPEKEKHLGRLWNGQVFI